MNKHHKNLHVLQNYNEMFNLRNNETGVSIFYSSIQIKTAKNFISLTGKLLITFDSFGDEGKLTFLEMSKELDPHLYPTEFKARYNCFEVEGNKLIISDPHSKNEEIGSWEAIFSNPIPTN